MKKILTLNFFITALGVVFLLLWLCPSITIYGSDLQAVTTVNYFQATFGAKDIASEAWIAAGGTQFSLSVCGGLVTAFSLAVAAIVCEVCRYKCRWCSLLAFGLFVASGVLMFCGIPLLQYSNFNISLSPSSFYFTMSAWPIVVGVAFEVLAVGCIIDFAMGGNKQTATY